LGSENNRSRVETLNRKHSAASPCVGYKAFLEDLHDENVFMDEEENLLFIDPVIYLETVDMGLAAKSIFHFPFT
jgi:hypothetical protein